MAAKYYHKYRGEFETAYLQHEVALDLKVKAAGGVASGDTPSSTQILHVGDIVKIVNNELQLVVAGAATENSIVDPALTTDMYIVAQSDQTMEYGHVPVELRDYRYVDTVADKTTVKKVALFRIINPQDVILHKVTFQTT